jgi:hypothetical protein
MRTRYQRFLKHLHKNSTSGSAALEYLIVSGFALVVSVTAVTWLGGVIKDKMNHIARQIHSDTDDINFDFDLGLEPTQ